MMYPCFAGVRIGVQASLGSMEGRAFEFFPFHAPFSGPGGHVTSCSRVAPHLHPVPRC